MNVKYTKYNARYHVISLGTEQKCPFPASSSKGGFAIWRRILAQDYLLNHSSRVRVQCTFFSDIHIWFFSAQLRFSCTRFIDCLNNKVLFPGVISRLLKFFFYTSTLLRTFQINTISLFDCDYLHCSMYCIRSIIKLHVSHRHLYTFEIGRRELVRGN